MAIPQGAMRSIGHDEVGGLIAAHPKVEQGHDMGMAQTYGASFVDEFLQVFTTAEPGVQDFDGHQAVFVAMFSKVDIPKASATHPAEQAIVAKLLTDTLGMTAHEIIPLVSQK
jgi:hypothetical protein